MYIIYNYITNIFFIIQFIIQAIKRFFHVLYSDTKFNEETLGQWEGKKGVGEDNLKICSI